MRAPIRWAIEWSSRDQLDGERRHFIWNGRDPHLFRTREEARRFINERYGYIASRPDLQSEPCGWRMPRPVQVRVELTPVRT